MAREVVPSLIEATEEDFYSQFEIRMKEMNKILEALGIYL